MFNDYVAARTSHTSKLTMKMCSIQCIFNDSGAARTSHTTKQTIKMYRNQHIFIDSGATKQTMNMHGNKCISNDPVASRAPTPPNKQRKCMESAAFSVSLGPPLLQPQQTKH